MTHQYSIKKNVLNANLIYQFREKNGNLFTKYCKESHRFLDNGYCLDFLRRLVNLANKTKTVKLNLFDHHLISYALI